LSTAENTNEETLVGETQGLQNDVCASFTADNGAFQIGRPTGVCPGSSEEQIANGAPLKRAPDFRAGW